MGWGKRAVGRRKSRGRTKAGGGRKGKGWVGEGRREERKGRGKSIL
jgi:hypothetical protein